MSLAQLWTTPDRLVARRSLAAGPAPEKSRAGGDARTKRWRFRRFFTRAGVRLALIQSLAVIASFAIAGYVSLFAINQINRAEMRNMVRGEMVSLEREYRQFGSGHLSTVVERRTRLSRAFSYRLTSADRRTGVGQLPAISESGWSTVQRDVPGRPAAHFLALTMRLPDGALLSVGQNFAAVYEESASVSQALIASGLLGIIFCLCFSYMFSRGTWRRIDALVRSAKAVAGGQLMARVPTGSGVPHDDLDELGRAFNVMLDQLGEMIAQVRQGSSDIAHDLRTPLSRVRQRLDKLRRNLDDKQARLRAIALIEADLDEVLGKFGALLRLAEIECEGPGDGDAPIDLAQLVLRMADTYKPDIEAEGRALSVEVEQSVIQGDAGLIAQAVANLLDNVLRHTPGGTAVRIRAGRLDGAAFLSVGDRGPGIPPEYRELALQRHWRQASHRPGSSFGLGLAIVAAIARRHRAHLTLTDARPGLTVTLVFGSEAQPSGL